jgi:hypothetical protein
MNMAKTSKCSKHWFLTVPETALNPKGDKETLVRAIDLLGQRSGEEVEVKSGNDIMLTREFAAESITAAARGFNALHYLEGQSPRLSDFTETISKLNKQLDAVRQIVAESDEFTSAILAIGARKQNISGLEYQDFTGPGGFDVRRARSRKAPSLIDSIDRISQQLARTKKQVSDRLQRKGKKCTDLGGHTNLAREFLGAPKWRLLIDCHEIYTMYRRQEATTTESGPFHEFVEVVYEFATGSPDAAMGHVIKLHLTAIRQSSRLLRQQQEIGDAIMANLDRQITLELDPIALTQERKAFQKLNAKRKRIEQNMYLAYRKSWPHMDPSWMVSIGWQPTSPSAQYQA